MGRHSSRGPRMFSIPARGAKGKPIRNERTSRRAAIAVSLAAIVATGAYLRFDGLGQAGIFGVDDGRNVLDGLAKVNELAFGWDLVQAKYAESGGGPELLLSERVPAAMGKLADPHPFAPKQGYAYAIAAVLVNGFTVSAGNEVEAFFGTLLILLTFGFVRYIHNAQSALAAAAFIALSAYCVYFSRNTYPQCISACFLVAAVWLHAVWHRRGSGLGWLLAVGVLAGMSFWTNYQVAGALPLIAVIHAVTCIRREHGIRMFVLGGTAIAIGFGFTLLCAEALSYPMILLFRSQDVVYPQATFFEVLWPRLTGQTAEPFNIAGLTLFPYFLTLFHGRWGAASVIAILFVGVLVALRRDPNSDECTQRSTIWVYFGIAFLVPFLIFSLKTMQGARMFVYALPFLAALVGVAITGAWTADVANRRMVRAVIGIGVMVALVSNAGSLREVRAVRSAMPDVIAFVKQQSDPRLCAAWSSIVRCYLLEANLEGGDLYRYLGHNETPPRWFVNDWQEFYDRRYPDESIALVEHTPPAYILDHTFGRIFLETEALPSHGDTIENLRWVRGLDRNRARKVLIYDLETSPLRTERPQD